MALVAVPTFLTGPGTLYYALSSAVNPTFTAAASAYPATVFSGAAGWSALGATEDGTEVSESATFEDVEAAEFEYPLDTFQTKLEAKIKASLVDFRAGVLAKMQNGGVITATGSAATLSTKVVAPSSASIIRCKIGFLSDDLTHAFIANRCVNTGGITTAFKRAPQKGAITMDMSVAQPTDGSAPLERYFAGVARA